VFIAAMTLYTVHSDGQELTKIGDISYLVNFPQWSADGQWIIYNDPSNEDVIIVKPDSSAKMRLESGNYPAMSSDSSALAYIDTSPDRRLCITVLSKTDNQQLETGNKSCIADSSAAGFPAWRPSS
jgi:Tol biopolymer transport system component